jgi:geranylgeranyl pyrophosphate synthase
MAVDLPGTLALEKLLDLRFPSAGAATLARATQVSLERSLLDPLKNFLGRSSKRLRAQLVELGAEMVGDTSRAPVGLEKRLAFAEQALEAVHAGSMVIDDIEDESVLRRGEPTLHRAYGLAPALNAGNWLYFYPLHSVRDWQLSPAQEVQVYRLFHTALLRAHFGQALDVGTPVDQLDVSEVEPLCLASIELKSGALTELAVAVGAAVASKDGVVPEWASRFGRGFGTALQMFDDVGNLQPVKGMEIKRFEDLALRRPSWVWAQAAIHFTSAEYGAFVRAVQEIPNVASLENCLQEMRLAERAKAAAVEFLNHQVLLLENALPENSGAWPRVRELQSMLVKAYG